MDQEKINYLVQASLLKQRAELKNNTPGISTILVKSQNVGQDM